jgi:hypothetical protein
MSGIHKGDRHCYCLLCAESRRSQRVVALVQSRHCSVTYHSPVTFFSMAHGGWRRFVFAFAAQLVLCRSGNHNSTRKISEFFIIESDD